MAKLKSQNAPVYVAIITNGHIGAPELFSKEGTERVRAEAIAAHKYLGVENTFFLDFPAPRLDTIPSYRLSLAIEKIIKENFITDLYVPHSGDIHKDHCIAYEACLVASRPIGCPVKKILAYETLSETEWAAPLPDRAFIPTVFVEINNFIEDKLHAFSMYSTQVKESPHPRSKEGITTLARLRGSTIGSKYAEAFMLVREII